MAEQAWKYERTIMGSIVVGNGEKPAFYAESVSSAEIACENLNAQSQELATLRERLGQFRQGMADSLFYAYGTRDNVADDDDTMVTAVLDLGRERDSLKSKLEAAEGKAARYEAALKRIKEKTFRWAQWSYGVEQSHSNEIWTDAADALSAHLQEEAPK